MMSVGDIAAVNTPLIAQYPDQESCVAGLVKEGLSEEVARRICSHLKSKGKQGLRKISFAYQASFEPYEEQGRHLAKIHVIDLAPNKNRWQVTATARARALKTLLDSPLLGPPPDGEKGNVIGGGPGSPHEGLWSPVGRFVDFQSNHVTHGIAEITKDYAWEKIKSGDWKAVSPSVLAFVEHQEGDVSVVDDFNFEHVLFVDKGAYPDASVEGVCEGEPGRCNFYQALATACGSQAKPFSITDQDLGTIEKAVQSARGILTSLEERLEIILKGKPDPEPVVPPLPLSSHTNETLGSRDVGNVGTSRSPNHTQVPEKKMGQKMEGGNEMNTTQASFGDASFPDECFAYVPDEAKGQDGKKSLRSLPYKNADGSVDPGHLRNALARWNQTNIPQDEKDEVLKTLCGAAKKAGIDSELCKEHFGGDAQHKEENKMANESNPCEQIQAAAKTQIDSLQAKVTALETENQSLKTFKAEVEKKQRMAKIQTIVDLKTHCGMIEEKDRAQTYADLDKLSADALDAVEKELTVVQARLESMPSGPKAKFNADAQRNQIEDVRESMFGYRRDEHGEIVK